MVLELSPRMLLDPLHVKGVWAYWEVYAWLLGLSTRYLSSKLLNQIREPRSFPFPAAGPHHP